MAEQQRKFGALAGLRQRLPPADEEKALTEPITSPAIEPIRRKGRPAGKRSNPEWKLYSHFLKKRTQREAAAIVQSQDDGRDLSDVLQHLLEQWVAERKA
jgi:hypothetical protein